MENTAYHHIKISQFEGPLDLLLQLIEAKNMEITVVSLSEVTDQYISCLKDIKEVCSEDLANFLSIISSLILIKSKALLPIIEIDKDILEDADDLARRLEEYRIVKMLGKKIQELDKRGVISFSRLADKKLRSIFYPPRNATANVLYKYFDKIFKEIFVAPLVLPQKELRELIKLEDIIKDLAEKTQNGSIKNFSDFLNKDLSRLEIIVTFLALLHLLKRKIIKAEQCGIFGEIAISKF
ncbi:MAG: segregation/condensation protein A [Patescibacteria group bacterium]